MTPGLSWSAAAVFVVLVLARVAVAELGTPAALGGRISPRLFDVAAGVAAVSLVVLLALRVLAEVK